MTTQDQSQHFIRFDVNKKALESIKFYNIALSEIIVDLIFHTDLTAEEIYTRAQISRRTYFNIIKGKTHPTLEVFFKIAIALSENPLELIQKVMQTAETISEYEDWIDYHRPMRCQKSHQIHKKPYVEQK